MAPRLQVSMLRLNALAAPLSIVTKGTRPCALWPCALCQARAKCDNADTTGPPQQDEPLAGLISDIRTLLTLAPPEMKWKHRERVMTPRK